MRNVNGFCLHSILLHDIIFADALLSEINRQPCRLQIFFILCILINNSKQLHYLCLGHISL